MSKPVERIRLTPDLVEAFAGAYLSPMYDNPVATPDFHRYCWEMYCTDASQVCIAAPRGHAKSTALTHDYGLAVAMFREQDYIVIASATEELAMGHLGDIAKEVRENEVLQKEFRIKGLSTDTKSDIVVDFLDGHQCRFIAKGSGQKMRGIKWNGKRPGLIIADDLEEDEQVENMDRRKKFRKWFYRALLPVLRKGGKVRFHGTIMHEDSLLARTTSPKNRSWLSHIFKAHKSFDDFAEILWPEQFDEERLKAIRQTFIDDGDAAGYSQEYLNDPSDHSDSYLRKDDFLPMKEADHEEEKQHYVGCDFAVSKADMANRTSFTVGGMGVRNLLHIVDQHCDRWDTGEWIDLLFIIQERYNPIAFFVEDGVIWKSVSPMIYKRMLKENNWINFVPILPVKDKATRGRNYQRRHKAGGMRFDKEAEWYADYEDENLKFTGVSDAKKDDQFDSTAILVKGIDTLPDVEEEDFITDEEAEFERQDPRRLKGRNATTGY